MLSINSYAPEYVDACRARVAAQLTTYRALDKAAGGAGPGHKPLTAALDSFAPVFFNNMVLVLDSYFCHRSRTMELKDGNPLNEVRVLCSSMLEGNSVLTADKSIKLDPSTSVLHHHVGDEIRLDEADFVRLSTAYFAEIERKFP